MGCYVTGLSLQVLLWIIVRSNGQYANMTKGHCNGPEKATGAADVVTSEASKDMLPEGGVLQVGQR